jgi:hypothetical protein
MIRLGEPKEAITGLSRSAAAAAALLPLLLLPAWQLPSMHG